ncbi:MAG: ABC transporter permease [Carnobacterium sp.]|uniref:ABC transporter permease n=1 Tax=Carnobacterium sp. TaxID=48221 RepID=UPI0033148454
MIGLIIVFISWLVFVLSGLGTGLSDLATSTLKYSEADYIVFEKETDFSFSKSILSEDLEKQLLDEKGVEAVASMGTVSASIRSAASDEENATKTDVLIAGIQPGSFMEPAVSSGKALINSNSNGVIVNESLKEDGFSLGDQLAINGSNEEVEIIGFVQNETLNHQPVIFAQLDKFRTIKYAAPGSDNGIENPVNGILLQGTDVDVEAINEKIDGIEIGTKDEAVNAVPGYTAENGTIMMMLWFLIIISAFIIGVFFYVLTNQKTQQFGVLKAIGGSNGFVIKTVISQVFVLSAISIIVGIGLTYLTAAVLPEGMPFNLKLPMVFIYSIVLLAISVLSSLFSVIKISKIDPLTALGRLE